MINFIIALFASSVSLAAFATEQGTCDVDRVYSGPNGAVVAKLTGCLGYDRTEMQITLRYRPASTVYYSSFPDLAHLQDVVVDATDVLAMKQTLELAKLNNHKLRLQLADSGAIEWMSLD